MKSYIIKSYPCIKIQLDYVNEITKDLDINTRHLFCHILVSNLLQDKTPIASQLIDRKLKGASWPLLYDRDLITVTNYSKNEGKSREYKVAESILLSYLELGDMPLQDDLIEPRYNLITGRKSPSILKSELYDDNNHKHPSLIVNAITTIKDNYFDLAAILYHVQQLKTIFKTTQSLFMLDPTNKELEGSYHEAKGLYVNDYNCYKILIGQRPIKIADNIWTYYPPYRVQMSGRISHIGGGLQSCSRTMKFVATQSIKDLHNYDLKSSQVNGLIQQFELANLDTSWLEYYVNNSNAKEEYAKQIGTSVDCWKDLICSTIMGAFIPSNSKKTIQNLEEGDNLAAILQTLSREFKGDIDKVLHSLDMYKTIVAPLKKQLELWHNWLLTTYVTTVGIKGKSNNIYLTNPTGMKLNITELKKVFPLWKVKSIVAAFVLQGQEAAFIHHLTVLSIKYNYKVCANEHDGLITIGEIPQQAINDAAIMSGLKYYVLIEKPLL